MSTITTKDKNLYYGPGDRFILKSPGAKVDTVLKGIYLLARVTTTSLALIHLTSGNRWIDQPLYLESWNTQGRVHWTQFNDHFFYIPWDEPEKKYLFRRVRKGV